VPGSPSSALQNINFLSPFTGGCDLGTILCFQNFETGDKNESVDDYFFK